MSNNVVDWVADKLAEKEKLEIVHRMPDGILIVKGQDDYEFAIAVLGARNVIRLADVASLFEGATKPQFVVNVPSATFWSGAAIDFIHHAPAAFGTLGDVSRAASTGDVPSYRDKNMGFFISAMRQHSNVSSVSYVFDRAFKAERKTGPSLIVAVVDAYNLSAEDVRNARDRFGDFDIVVKSSSHGSITHQAEEAAQSMNVEALTFGELMRRLAK
ncbi:MAG: hypothetical protein QM740_16595 [Acidovorax sp.]